jgi:phosphoglycolate phosphatase-like HAD superfamily hydrolase
MRAHGIGSARIEELMPRMIELAQDFYEATVPEDLRDKTCPGVPELLERLRVSDTALALVTGNLTRIGWRKIERAGLRDYFLFGAFGEMASTRGGLARLAIEKARADRLIDSGSPVALIGDAPQDVIAAQENSIRSIAVRTGITPAGDLEACHPDYIFDDLTCLEISIL